MLDRTYRPSPAAVLRIIREGKSTTLNDLETVVTPLVPIESIAEVYLVQKQVRAIVDEFVEAGLVAWVEDKLVATNAVEKVQRALEFSLSELVRRDEGAVQVNPAFGKPSPLSAPFDVFVVMPFQEELRAIYEGPIRTASLRLKLKVGRGDDFFSGDPVVAEIWSALWYCKAVVADCTGRNPNVFYEIGIAHTLGKPVVLLTQELEDVPFDLRHLRMIEYQPTVDGKIELKEALCDVLQAVLQC